MSALDHLAERLYPGSRTGRPSPVDGTIAFYKAFFARLSTNATLLDFGAGRGAAFTSGRSPAASVLLHLAPKVIRRIGVDVDRCVLENPALDEAHVIIPDDNYRIPLPDASVDAILADWVLEHLPNPLPSLRECRRVLRSGGIFGARTPHAWHYSCMVSRAFGQTRFGKTLLRIAQPNRQGHDIFPTYYKANTRATAEALLLNAGFQDAEALTHEPEPSYLMFSRPTLLLGWAYERLARRGLLPRASLMIFGVA